MRFMHEMPSSHSWDIFSIFSKSSEHLIVTFATNGILFIIACALRADMPA